MVSEADLLDVFEDYASSSTLGRALALVALACPIETKDVLTDWPIGRRDSALLELRESLFGKQLAGVTKCPNCKADVEIAFDTEAIRTNYATGAPFNFQRIGLDGTVYQLKLCPISSRALLESDVNREQLLKRCIIALSHSDDEGDSQLPIEIPVDVIQACDRALAECDPQSDIQLELICANCEHSWNSPFDIATYLWQEIGAWAGRTLREIHAIASVYGWTEREILNLTPKRRRSYLQMVVG